MNLIRIIIGAGGTGGHLFPGIAVARELMKRNSKNRVLFVNTGKPFEKTVLGKAGFDQASISAEGIKGRSVWKKVKSIFRIPIGIIQSIQLIKGFGPNIVLGLGSYSAGVVVLGAWVKRIKIAVHEQNRIPGITNRILFYLADRIYVSFPNTRDRIGKKNILVTGNPIRDLRVCGENIRTKPENLFTILVLGGSQGAHRINTAMTEAVSWIKEIDKIRIIHQTGQMDELMVKTTYDANRIKGTVSPFFDDMGACYAQADLVICRAGATTIAEVTALGKPSIFIPYPFAADDHQTANAGELVEAGAAELIPEKQLNGKQLAERIRFYMENRNLLEGMAVHAARFGKPDAASVIVDDIYQTLEHKSSNYWS
jgi:UDP-N-acetylglucosamine--N-acetylmuramyl-(pentapeptide) pyrophosphoryl-undecaprenol N-acetylglucosamine transferase